MAMTGPAGVSGANVWGLSTSPMVSPLAVSTLTEWRRGAFFGGRHVQLVGRGLARTDGWKAERAQPVVVGAVFGDGRARADDAVAVEPARVDAEQDAAAR